MLQVRDGADDASRLIKTIPIRNYTRPESIVTTANNLFVKFSAQRKVKTEIYLEITVGVEKTPDLNVTESDVSDNNGRGVWVEKLRSNLHIHHSRIQRNNHVAGLHVNYGAGYVNITHSQITHNYVDGVNITYGGGCQNISWSEIADNVGTGLSIWFNETSVNQPMRQEFVLAYSNISLNHDIGVLVGNYCGPSVVNASGNFFVLGRYVGLQVLSCWRDSELEGFPTGDTLLQIGHNHFEHNEAVAVKLSPLARTVGRIEHNDFVNNVDGCLFSENEDDFILEIQRVDLTIEENRFYRNRGSFVLRLGLSHYDYKKGQNLLMRFNWVMDNTITEPWVGLNPRSKVAAPVVIASANVKLERNILDNPESRYELGSHLIEPNTELDCRHNWFGDKDEERVWSRVFDRDDRYNLAKIAYIPYLLSNNINTELVLERPLFEHQFINYRTREVGGDVAGVEELREDGVYIVRRDINVRPSGRLKITPGVILKFEHSVGMMVSGELIAEGDKKGGQPVFTMLEIIKENEGNVTDGEDDQELENSVSSSPVRLVGGLTDHEGRLQVNIDGQWGTVCDFEWTIQSAAIACQQMGLVLNPEDWKILPSDMPREGTNDPILMTYVRCNDLDTDIRKCKRAEHIADFVNSCSHEFDVGLRCYDVSWAGLRLGMTAKRSKLYDVKVERAGLFDYRTFTFMPGIQADFSHHVFEALEIRDNYFDGLGIMYSDIYYPDHVNFVKDSLITGNKRHGISFRQLGMRIVNTEIRDNIQAGVFHDPKLTKLEQRELAEWMSLIDESIPGTIIRFPNSKAGSSKDDPIILREKESKLIITSANMTDSKRTYYIRTERDEFVIGMQLINPFHNYTTEELIIYNFHDLSSSERIRRWNVSRDIASFPTVSSSYAITLEFDPGQTPLGNMMLMLTPINCANLPGNCNPSAYFINPLDRNKIYDGPIPRLTISNSRIAFNGQGLMAIHYNRFLGHDSQVYLRKANESVEVFDSEISSNKEAIYVFTPFRELNQFNISEITYMINRTRFSDNRGGIFQYSKDLRDSNNIYHWVLRENMFEQNQGGGMDISLPYVWQYNENHTHTVHLDSNTFQQNKDFGIHIGGHFARVYIVNNTLLENSCEEGLISLTGMEKESWIFANDIKNNDGIFMTEFDLESQSEIMGFVAAYFSQNVVQNNKHSHHRLGLDAYHPASYTLAIKGVQKFNITNNLFGNDGLDYELLAGVKTARVGNILNAESNYWGTSDINAIREKLFDFDDWNSYSVTHFLPYLLENSFESTQSAGYVRQPDIDFDNLGGRIYESVRLFNRRRPYIIKRDLTVMPDVTLTIDAGVELQFYPSVGILVLGTLYAQGNIEQNIVMRPVKLDEVKDYRVGRRKRQSYGSSRHGPDFDVRLCQANENGTICPEGADQGFLEIFNRTTMQWVPMCDTRFTERNAEVVCRQLGYSDLNVYLEFGQRHEYHEISLSRIIYWPEPFQCTGKEKRLSHCPIRMNGQIYTHNWFGQIYGCDWQSKNFAFIHCGKRNLDTSMEYWGGIRFSVHNFEQELFHEHIHDAVSHSNTKQKESVLQYVQIIGAGILHNEKSPAVQSVMKSPLISSVNISQSAFDGINIISPAKTVNLLYNKIENNMCVGVSAAILTGEIRDAENSAFVPVKEIPLPYNTFGMIDICDPHKEIIIEERILLYYKYDNNPVDCVKIFASVYDVKPIGFRLLQYNFVNSSGEPWIPDHLTLYDGDIYNYTTKPLTTIKVDGKNLENKLWSSTKNNALSIKFHATGARNSLGFVAEVVTLPISFVGIDRYVRHNISFSVFNNNERGAVKYTSAGEMNPILTLARNQFDSNCNDLYGNFSTCKSAVHLDIQNTQDVFFHNNYVTRNIGGLYIRAGSSGTATSLKGVLHNNVFSENVKEVTLHLEGIQTSPYQHITMYRNYMTRNNVSHLPVVVMNQVVCNTSYNTFFNNYGKVILEITGYNNVRLPIYQSFTHNGFHNNFAYGLHCDRTTLKRCQWGSRATIVAGSAGQEYVDNVFYNLENDYELVTLNRSQYDVWKTPINAKYNYWAYNETYAVAGRIKDLNDEDGLLEVDFTPFHMNNRTLMSGKCHPGWTLLGDSTCFMYHGAPMSFHDAKNFCAKDNASMPYLMERYYEIHHYLENQQEDWRYYDMVWVQHLDSPPNECTVFVDGGVEAVSCDFLLPTLCELDPHVNPGFSLSHLEDYVTIASLSAAAGCVLLIIIISLLWCSKTRTRKKERFERRNSIRLSKSSLGSRSVASIQSAGFSDINYRRKMISGSRQPSIVGLQPYAEKRNSSFDSIEKRSSALNSTIDDTKSAFDLYEAKKNIDPVPFGGHLSPGSQNFMDLHGNDVHYASGLTSVSATIHRAGSTYDAFENRAYTRQTMNTEDSQRSLWQASQNTLGIREADSMMELKRDLANQFESNGGNAHQKQVAAESSNTSDTTQSTDQEYQVMEQDYQTMERERDQDRDYIYSQSTFRPSSQPIYGHSQTSTLQLHPPQQPQAQQPYNNSQQHLNTIPSVPGYAKPFAHQHTEQQGAVAQTQNHSRSQHRVPGSLQNRESPPRPFLPPPDPPQPQERPKSELLSRSFQRTDPARLSDTSTDSERPYYPRSKSMQILETNLDEDAEDEATELVRQRTGKLSRSMQLLSEGALSMNSNLLETDM